MRKNKKFFQRTVRNPVTYYSNSSTNKSWWRKKHFYQLDINFTSFSKCNRIVQFRRFEKNLFRMGFA